MSTVKLRPAFSLYSQLDLEKIEKKLVIFGILGIME